MERPSRSPGPNDRLTGVLGVHQLVRVVDVVEADEVAELVVDDGLRLVGFRMSPKSSASSTTWPVT